MKIMERLALNTLATFETYVIPVSEGGIAGEIPRNIMFDIAENIVP